MRVSKISDGIYSRKTTNNKNTNYNIKYVPANSVSFGSVTLASWGINRLTSAVLGAAVKDGYKSLRTASEQAKFKTDLVSRMVNVGYHSSQGISPVDVLFAFSKTISKDEPESFWYSVVKDKFNGVFSLENLKDCALKMLFPYVKEGDNDMNCGHAAKVALLTNMVDTGEYLNSQYFFKAFKDLPDNPNLPAPINYNRNKVVLLEKMMRDKNAAKAAYDICGHGADDKRTLAVAALVSTLPKEHYQKFFSDYYESIDAIFNKAYKLIHENYLNSSKTNEFYNSYYAHGLTSKNGGKFVTTSSLNAIYNETFIYAQPIFEQYYMKIMDYFKDNKEEGMKYFNVTEKYFDDMVRDYEMLKYVKNMKEKDVVHKLLKLRADEKLKSGDDMIKNTAAGFLNLSGHARDFLETYKDTYPEVFKELLLQSQEVRWHFHIYRGEWLEGDNGVECINYRYDDRESYLEKYDFLRTVFKDPGDNLTNEELYNKKAKTRLLGWTTT